MGLQTVKKISSKIDGADLGADNVETPPTSRKYLPWFFRRASPYLGGIVTLVFIAMLMFTMYFTWYSWQWVAFLSGLLGASVLSFISRSIKAERQILRQTVRLAALREKLADEVRKRVRTETDPFDVKKDTLYSAELLPAMVVYLSPEQKIIWHNRAFGLGLGMNFGKIDGRHIREVVGDVAYGQLEADLIRAFGGAIVHQKYRHYMQRGRTLQLLLQFLPQLNGSREVVGVFMLASDLPATDNLGVPAVAIPGSEINAVESPRRLVDGLDDENEGDAEGLRVALAHNEFCLFFQTIKPLTASGGITVFREILLRLKLEEAAMIPPGSFMPIAERYGMLPALDRWVVRHLLAWIRLDAKRKNALYSVNITPQTLEDVDFPAFVKEALYDFGLPGSLVCFELQETDTLSHSANAFRFVGQLQSVGCQHALCGFSGSHASLELLRQAQFNFVKIDGGLILNIKRSRLDFERVATIHRAAQAVGISTIAEYVEDNETLEQLRLIGVDFAQGFGISRPQNLPHTDEDAKDQSAPLALP